jgi:hypothetical protein
MYHLLICALGDITQPSNGAMGVVTDVDHPCHLSFYGGFGVATVDWQEVIPKSLVDKEKRCFVPNFNSEVQAWLHEDEQAWLHEDEQACDIHAKAL